MPPLIKPFGTHAPTIAAGCFVAENVVLIGDVVLGEEVNIWYGTTIRGDVGRVVIEKRANIQDMCCVHMTKNLSNTWIGEQASVGHSAIIHGAAIGPGALVGMGCIVMDNATIGEQAILGAGSLVTQGAVIPPRSLALGRPAKVVRALTEEELSAGQRTAARYLDLAEQHRSVSFT